jgi:hypothetical protein
MAGAFASGFSPTFAIFKKTFSWSGERFSHDRRQVHEKAFLEGDLCGNFVSPGGLQSMAGQERRGCFC